MRNIHPLPRQQKTCAHCHIRFKPKDNRHRFCIACWRYARASAHIVAAVELLRPVTQ